MRWDWLFSIYCDVSRLCENSSSKLSLEALILDHPDAHDHEEILEGDTGGCRVELVNSSESFAVDIGTSVDESALGAVRSLKCAHERLPLGCVENTVSVEVSSRECSANGSHLGVLVLLISLHVLQILQALGLLSLGGVGFPVVEGILSEEGDLGVELGANLGGFHPDF